MNIGRWIIVLTICMTLLAEARAADSYASLKNLPDFSGF